MSVGPDASYTILSSRIQLTISVSTEETQTVGSCSMQQCVSILTIQQKHFSEPKHQLLSIIYTHVFKPDMHISIKQCKIWFLNRTLWGLYMSILYTVTAKAVHLLCCDTSNVPIQWYQVILSTFMYNRVKYLVNSFQLRPFYKQNFGPYLTVSYLFQNIVLI